MAAVVVLSLPSVACAWTVESVNDGRAVQIARGSGDTTETVCLVWGSVLPLVALSAWDDALVSGEAVGLRTQAVPPSVRSFQVSSASYSELMVEIDGSRWTMLNPYSLYFVADAVPANVAVKNQVNTTVSGQVQTNLQGVRSPVWDEGSQTFIWQSQRFGPGFSLGSAIGTLPVSVSSMPTTSVGATGSMQSTLSAGWPSTITVTGIGAFDSDALTGFGFVFLMVMAGGLLYALTRDE